MVSKQELITQKDSELPSDEYLVFHPPTPELLLSESEILNILKDLKGLEIPSSLSTVQKSQWVKFEVIKKLGYKKPSGLRTKEARKYKPKFINQLLDIFVQSSNNLQIWNYIPYDENILDGEWNTAKIKYIDCRYAIIKHDSNGLITKVGLKKGSELKSWDGTGTKTIKWQANAPLRLRQNQIININEEDPAFEKISNDSSTDNKLSLITGEDVQAKPLIKSNPTPTMFLSLLEIKDKIEGLLGTKVKNPGSGQERVIGQFLEKKIAECLGYKKFSQTDSGAYPDLLHQLLEVKFQWSGTIDLGMNLPTNPEKIEQDWNIWNLSFSDMRYCIFLMNLDQKTDTFQVDSIVLTSGHNFSEFFNICTGTNFKVQMTIKESDLN